MHESRPEGDLREIAAEPTFKLKLPRCKDGRNADALGIVPDVLTDQTSAHDLRTGYIPAGLSMAEADVLRVQKNGKVDAPSVIGRDHLDTGSVASPNRETENMLDGSDAIADWPLLNAMINDDSIMIDKSRYLYKIDNIDRYTDHR